MDDWERRYYEQPSTPGGGWDDPILWVIFGPMLLFLIILAVLGLGMLGHYLAGPVSRIVITAIVPHWHAIVIWLAIAVISPWLVRFLIFLLTPPVRRARIRWYWRRRAAAQRRRYQTARRELYDAYEETMESIEELNKGAMAMDDRSDFWHNNEPVLLWAIAIFVDIAWLVLADYLARLVWPNISGIVVITVASALLAGLCLLAMHLLDPHAGQSRRNGPSANEESDQSSEDW
jgi:hypothetical protein